MTRRIALVTGMYPTPDSPYGGIFIGHRIVALRALGVDVTPYAVQITDSALLRILRAILRRQGARAWGKTTSPLAPGGVEYRVISVSEGPIAKVLNKLTSYRFQVARIGRAVSRAVGGSQVDAIHAHWAFTTGAGVRRAAERLDLPVILTCHGSDVNVVGADPRFRSQVMRTLDEVHEVEFVSEALQIRARELGYKGMNASVVPNGIWAEPAEQETGATAIHHGDALRILYVGSLREIKGADRIPEIFDAIASRARTEVEFRVVGGGALHDSLAAWAQSSGATIMGAVPPEAVESEMRRADVLVMPSRNEGWPTVVLEAHAVGLPVVATDAGGTAEAVGDDRVILPVECPAELFAERVLAVLEGRISVDPAELQKRAATYDWRRLAQQTIATYERVLDAR